MITFDDFAKVELKVGTVLAAEEVEGSEKLIKLKIDLGEESPRQIMVGIKKWYQPAYFVGKQLVIVANLEPKMMMDEESQGMVLAAAPLRPSADGLRGASGDKPVLLTVTEEVAPGVKIR